MVPADLVALGKYPLHDINTAIDEMEDGEDLVMLVRFKDQEAFSEAIRTNTIKFNMPE